MFKQVASATAAFLCLTGAALAQSPGNVVVFAIFENPEPHHGCIVSERNRDGGYDNLVLGRCDSPAARFIFDERAKRIRPAARPNLCVGDTTGAGDAPFDTILRDCRPDGVGQFYTYNRGRRLIVALTEDNREERDGYASMSARSGAGAPPSSPSPANTAARGPRRRPSSSRRPMRSALPALARRIRLRPRARP